MRKQPICWLTDEDVADEQWVGICELLDFFPIIMPNTRITINRSVWSVLLKPNTHGSEKHIFPKENVALHILIMSHSELLNSFTIIGKLGDMTK